MRLGAVAGLMIATMTATQPLSGGVTPTKNAPAATKCPGWLRADQDLVGGQRTMWTIALEDKDRHPLAIVGTMGVHVVFQGAQTRTRALKLSVSYLPAGLREVPAEGGKGAQEMEKIYALKGDDKTRVEGDLLVGAAATVTRVRLISATFADGSEWHAGSNQACSVEPNRVLSVEGKESSLAW
jgi:hypothetical protein